jgi:hypothetical protein
MTRQSIRDSEETAKQSETAARFLEDLAVHADSDNEKQQLLAIARNFRLAVYKKPKSPKRSKGESAARPSKHNSSSGGPYG